MDTNGVFGSRPFCIFLAVVGLLPALIYFGLESIIVSALLGLIPAVLARNKGRDWVIWWAYGAALLIVALPHALFMKSRMSRAVGTR